MNRDSVVFYLSFYEAIRELPEMERLKAFEMVFDYAFKGVEPTDNGIALAIFKLVKPQIDANNKRYENGKKPKQNGSKTEAKPKQSGSKTEANSKQNISESEANVNVNVNDNVNVNVNDKEKYKEKTAKRFIPPTEAELLDYCIAKSIDIDVEAFMDFYASKGWKVGSQPMKDWQAAVRNWARRDTARSGTKAKNNLGTFGNYKQTSTDDEWNELMQLGG